MQVSTLKHIPVEDIQAIIPKFWCVNLMEILLDSDVSFGNNAYTFISKNKFSDILATLDELSSEQHAEIMAKIPDDVFVSIDC